MYLSNGNGKTHPALFSLEIIITGEDYPGVALAFNLKFIRVITIFQTF